MKNSPPGMAPFERQGEIAVPIAVEMHSERFQIFHRPHCFAAQNLGGGDPDHASAGGDRVGQMPLRAVVVCDRGGEAALGPIARGLSQGGRGHERDPDTCATCAQSGVQAGGSSADDTNRSF